MVRRFSETAFQRGTLSGAVLQGTGQMMLFSCLKKTIGQSQPDKWQQRKLFEKASPMRNVPVHPPDREVFSQPSFAGALDQALLELPPLRLEELAALVGNPAVLEQQFLPLEETHFSLPEAPETAPFPVPDIGPVPTAQPPTLTDGAWSGRTFDPAGLSY